MRHVNDILLNVGK